MELDNCEFDLGTRSSLCCSAESRVAKSISGEYYPQASLMPEQELHKEEQHVCTATVSFCLATADCKAAKLEGFIYSIILSKQENPPLHSGP